MSDDQAVLGTLHYRVETDTDEDGDIRVRLVDKDDRTGKNAVYLMFPGTGHTQVCAAMLLTYAKDLAANAGVSDTAPAPDDDPKLHLVKPN